MKLTSKLVYLFFLLLVFGSLFLGVKVSKAQAPVPPPGNIPCTDTEDPEFNSLRPYQASPCGDAPKATWCGNRIFLYETYKEKRSPGGYVEESIEEPSHNATIKKTYVIELSDLELPIEGNTELTKNSSNDADQIDDAQKMNEYVSWYLNGVNNRAENFPLTGEDEEDARKIIDFSGPINKLLSLDSLTRKRIESVESVSKKTNYVNEDTGTNVSETERHDQIVGCTIAGIPVPCYGGFLSQLLDNEKRLSDWKDHLPPLREDYDNYSDYYVDYRKWRGESCAKINIPVINKEALFCFNNPLKPDYWSTLFNNIPLSSTEDKKGKLPVGNTANPHAVGQAEISFKPGSTVIEGNPTLFFPHTEENYQLSELLNSTYVSIDAGDNEINYETTEPDRDKNGDCRLLNVRSNEGDNLFAEVPPNSYTVTVDYEFTKIKCHESYLEYVGPNDDIPRWRQDCDGQAYVELVTQTKTPYTKDLFTETTAGSASTFRKMFPKVGEGAPVECIANIPTVTKATYELTQGDEKGTEMKIESADRKTTYEPENAELHFPYIGSVYEYFLKGIQTALRPKGYGEPITNGDYCKSLEDGDCSFDMDKINKAIQNAASKYNVPASLLNAIFEIEMADEIADPSSYMCEENEAGAAGVAQVVKSTYDLVTCANEKMEDDIGMCAEYNPKLSRCNIDDAFELMARILIYKAGRFRSCTSTSGISESEKEVWYNAACNYYGSHNPDQLTINYANEIPESEKRQNGDMNYCDIVCWRMGQCPDYP